MVIDPDDLAGAFSFHTPDIAVDHFDHGDGIMAGKVGLVPFYRILNQPR